MSSTENKENNSATRLDQSLDYSSPDEELPETRKTLKRTISSLEEMNKDHEAIIRKWKNLVKNAMLISPTSKDGEIGAWPLELVLVRHGQSEGNEAVARSKRGDLSAYTPEFKKKHSSAYRLTDKGIEQAKTAGKWIKENIGDRFDRYYTSEYVRAMETASLLELPEAKWFTEIGLRERDKGLLDNVSWIERTEKYNDEMERRKRDAFFWSPPGGESLAHVCTRIEHTFNTLRRECSNQRVIVVCHGEVMWAFRVRLERLTQIRFHQLQASKDPKDKIHNAQILHYTRIHPQTGEIFPYFNFVRSVSPHKPEYSTGWEEFERPTFSNEELFASVQTVPRYVNNIPEDEKHPEVDF